MSNKIKYKFKPGQLAFTVIGNKVCTVRISLIRIIIDEEDVTVIYVIHANKGLVLDLEEYLLFSSVEELLEDMKNSFEKYLDQ
tara:strand:+ start:776 stop:1024 length:249 start_codon:yes stop_codon:yes gene_type:complete